MTFETFKLTGLATLVMSVPALAFAQLNVGDMAGTTEEDIVAKLKASGAVIEEVEIEEGMIEVEYLLDGAEFEVTVDLASGTVTEVETDDEDGDDDDDDDADDDDADDDDAENDDEDDDAEDDDDDTDNG